MYQIARDIVERVAKFIRSVIPADPAQLLILTGAVCLTVSPHLRFWPPEFIPGGGSRAELRFFLLLRWPFAYSDLYFAARFWYRSSASVIAR